jgi:5-methylcytosine-specific restriction enzyme subunit McrC
LVVTHTNSFGDTERYLIDTKWKIIDAQHPSDDDLKQMFAYNAYWEADKSMLLYPRTHNQPEKFGIFHKGIPGQSRCKLGFANVLNENGGINLEIGDEILEKLLSD